MKLVDLEREGMEMPTPGGGYPSGCCLYLGPDELEKLGYPDGLPAGTKIRLEGNAVIAGDRLDQDMDAHRLEVQILELGIEPDGMTEGEEEETKTAGAKVYG